MPRPYELYRHFNEVGDLLYVGITCNMLTRLRQHKNVSNWYDQIVRITIERFPTKVEARRAEREAIKNERPKHNLWTEERKGPHARRPEVEGERNKLIEEAKAKNIRIDGRWCLSMLEMALRVAPTGVPYPYQ